MTGLQKSLKQFYGLDAPDPEREARDIDSPHFQARAFYEESLQTDSLPKLLAKEQSLVSEIQSFDSDLQTLVYDNYSKFLGASDTVDSLSESISTMTDKMNHLRDNLTGVAKHSEEIGADLEPNRQKIQRLVGISRLLERVEFISKLPTQLRACLNARKFASAVNVWTKVERILSTQHFPSFKKINEECVAIMGDIGAKIRWQMLNMDVSVNDSMEYAVLLVKLKVPLSTVCSQLSHHWFLVVDNALECSETVEEPFTALSQLKKMVIDECALFVKLYHEKLCTLESNGVEKGKVEGILSEFRSNVFERIVQVLPVESLFGLDCRKIGSYLSLFQDLMSPIATQQQISKYFYRILKACTEAKMGRVFEVVREDVNGKGGMDLYQYMTTQFPEACHNLVSEFQVLVVMDHRECSHFLTQQISLMFEKVFELFEISNPENALVYSVITSAFGEKHIPQIFEHLASLEHDSPLQNLQGKVASDCKNTGITCLTRYVVHERQVLGQVLFKAIRSRKWKEMIGEPTRASDDIHDFIEKVQALITQVNNLLALVKPATHQDNETTSWQKRAVLKSTSFYSTPTEPTFCGVREEGIQQIDRLFTSVNRLRLNQPLQFECQSILSSIIMYAMKTMLELIRLECFTNHGFNQIQVDGYAIYSALHEVADQQEIFAALIEEIISSAGDRTIEPVPLDLSLLRTLAAA